MVSSCLNNKRLNGFELHTEHFCLLSEQSQRCTKLCFWMDMLRTHADNKTTSHLFICMRFLWLEHWVGVTRRVTFSLRGVWNTDKKRNNTFSNARSAKCMNITGCTCLHFTVKNLGDYLMHIWVTGRVGLLVEKSFCLQWHQQTPMITIPRRKNRIRRTRTR